jgi:hypothetical protein
MSGTMGICHIYSFLNKKNTCSHEKMIDATIYDDDDDSDSLTHISHICYNWSMLDW